MNNQPFIMALQKKDGEGNPEEEESAARLVFPKELKNAIPISISEVRLLLEHRYKQMEHCDDYSAASECFYKTLDYCRTFSKFNTPEVVTSVKSLLLKKSLHKFEIAMLMNLCPYTPEEARGLIPSLAVRFNDEELGEIIDDLQTKRSFQGN